MYKTGEIVTRKASPAFKLFNKGEYRDCVIKAMAFKTKKVKMKVGGKTVTEIRPVEGRLRVTDTETLTVTNIFLDWEGTKCKSDEDAAKKRNYAERIANWFVEEAYLNQLFPGYDKMEGTEVNAVALYGDLFRNERGIWNQVDWIGSSVKDIDERIEEAAKRLEDYKTSKDIDIEVKSTPGYDEMSAKEKSDKFMEVCKKRKLTKYRRCEFTR